MSNVDAQLVMERNYEQRQTVVKYFLLCFKSTFLYCTLSECLENINSHQFKSLYCTFYCTTFYIKYNLIITLEIYYFLKFTQVKVIQRFT